MCSFSARTGGGSPCASTSSLKSGIVERSSSLTTTPSGASSRAAWSKPRLYEARRRLPAIPRILTCLSVITLLGAPPLLHVLLPGPRTLLGHLQHGTVRSACHRSLA